MEMKVGADPSMIMSLKKTLRKCHRSIRIKRTLRILVPSKRQKRINKNELLIC